MRKPFLSDCRYERRIPSVASIGSWRKVLATAQGAGREVSEILANNHYVLEYDNMAEGRHVEKFIGQKVFDDGAKPMDSHGDSSRYWTNYYNTPVKLSLREGWNVVTGDLDGTGNLRTVLIYGDITPPDLRLTAPDAYQVRRLTTSADPWTPGTWDSTAGQPGNGRRTQ